MAPVGHAFSDSETDVLGVSSAGPEISGVTDTWTGDYWLELITRYSKGQLTKSPHTTRFEKVLNAPAETPEPVD